MILPSCINWVHKILQFVRNIIFFDSIDLVNIDFLKEFETVLHRKLLKVIALIFIDRGFTVVWKDVIWTTKKFQNSKILRNFSVWTKCDISLRKLLPEKLRNVNKNVCIPNPYLFESFYFGCVFFRVIWWMFSCKNLIANIKRRKFLYFSKNSFKNKQTF